MEIFDNFGVANPAIRTHREGSEYPALRQNHSTLLMRPYYSLLNVAYYFVAATTAEAGHLFLYHSQNKMRRAVGSGTGMGGWEGDGSGRCWSGGYRNRATRTAALDLRQCLLRRQPLRHHQYQRHHKPAQPPRQRRRNLHLRGPEPAAYPSIKRGGAGGGQSGAWVGALGEIVHHALVLPAEISLRMRREFGQAHRAGAEGGVEGRQ